MGFWHDIPQPIIGLSPMDGVTDPAFRFIVAPYGKPDVQVTEFINVDDVCQRAAPARPSRESAILRSGLRGSGGWTSGR